MGISFPSHCLGIQHTAVAGPFGGESDLPADRLPIHVPPNPGQRPLYHLIWSVLIQSDSGRWVAVGTLWSPIFTIFTFVVYTRIIGIVWDR